MGRSTSPGHLVIIQAGASDTGLGSPTRTAEYRVQRALLRAKKKGYDDLKAALAKRYGRDPDSLRILARPAGRDRRDHPKMPKGPAHAAAGR